MSVADRIEIKKLGKVPFARSSEWLAERCVYQFQHAIYAILKGDPEMPEQAVGEAMMDYFEPDRLEFDEPVLTQVSWCKRPAILGDDIYQCHVHEAHVPFRGTHHLWQLRGAEGFNFRTRIRYTESNIRFLMLRTDCDTEAFRGIVQNELAAAKKIAASQDGQLSAFRWSLQLHVEYYLNHNSIETLREEARGWLVELEKKNRASKHL